MITKACNGSLYRSSLFNNQKYSDTTVYLGKSKTPLKVHRVVLGSSSSYWDNIFSGEVQEFYFENSPFAHWRVFQYIYTGDYSGEAIDDMEIEGMPTLFN